MGTITDNGNGAHRAKRTAGDTSSTVKAADIFAFVNEHCRNFESDNVGALNLIFSISGTEDILSEFEEQAAELETIDRLD